MKKYTKPTINVVELSIKESLSALPTSFSGINAARMGSKPTTGYRNVTIYTQTSDVKQVG